MAGDRPRIALVTGAGSGIGRTAALALQGAGWTVVLAGRREDALAETAAAAGASGPKMLAVPTDVTAEADVTSLFTTIAERYGRLDLLFNNAGTGARPAEVDELSLDDWHAVVDVNLHGAFYCARGAFGLMKRQQPKGGRIINNGSISAHVPRPWSAPYTATKHAITGLTRALSLDGRVHDIACGQIDIGNAATPMTERMTQGVPQADGSVAVEPVFDVENVGETILYMATLPLSVNVQFITIMATKMPFIGRG